MGMSFIDACRKAFITEQELYEGLRCDSYDALFSHVKELVAQGRLSPVHSSGGNGRIPSLFRRYRIIRIKEAMEDYRKEIIALHPSLHIEGYLVEPHRYPVHRELLLPLSSALGKRPDWFSSCMSLNEKSFLLYGDEKRLVRERRKMEAILSFNGLSWALFHAYETPEPFFSWNIPVEQTASSSQAAAQENDIPGYPSSPWQTDTVLVLENKDIWYTLIDLAREHHFPMLFPECVTCLIYGEGNKVCREQGSLTEYLEQAHPDALSGRIWYAGDLDAEGVRIWQRMCINNPDLTLGLHRPIYQAMAAWAKTTWDGHGFLLPLSSDERNAAKLSESEWQAFLLETGADVLYHQGERDALARALAAGGRIPQEAANRMVLRDLLMKTRKS